MVMGRGHADGNANLLGVAMKEAKEETGLKQVTPVLKDIFSIEILGVAAHEKKVDMWRLICI